jgi:two-component system OmpR family sensor kinase
MKPRSLRVRLILTFTGLIVLGFGGLALLAGQQISSAARSDYEFRLTNEVTLISRSLAEASPSQSNTPPTDQELNAILAGLSSQAGIHVDLLAVRTENSSSFEQDEHFRNGIMPEQGWPLPDELRQYPELVAASRNVILVDHRNDANGHAMLFTAAPVVAGPYFMGYVQLSEPASVLQRAVRERWVALGLGVLSITAVALIASIWLSASLIRPLEKLRDSALRLSRGELSHRVDLQAQDEIGAVALAFNQMAEQVQAMIEEQRAFASNASHELRTPLTTMRLRTEALRHDRSLDTTTQQQYIVELDDELVRLSGLVNDLVLLSRLDAGRAEIGTEQIDPVRFAHSLQQTMATQAGDHQITLTLESAVDRPVTVNGSLNHLTVLFRNLLENAIKYTPSGGQITWRIFVEGENVMFTVQDTGQGIAPEQLPHVFERFYRADKSHSRSIPGTGLGLTLAKSIVETYGGRIEITSPGVGLGTTVTISWPVVCEITRGKAVKEPDKLM